jgi:hypothetical protein
MADVYKRIKRYKGIDYYLQTARANSRYSQIIAEPTDARMYLVAEIDNKTSKISYLENILVPQEVKAAIEAYAK